MHIDSIRKLFTEVRFSEAGTTARTREEAAYMHFVDYLDDCERGMRDYVFMTYIITNIGYKPHPIIMI